MNSDQQNYNYDDDNYYQHDQNNQDYHQYDDGYYMEEFDTNHYFQQSNSLKEYQVLPYNALLSEVGKHLKTAREMTALPQGWCLLLLRQFKWDIDLLADYFQDVEKYTAKINFHDKHRNPDQNVQKTGTCEVCCSEDATLFQNICGHGYCQECWKSHLQTSILGNNPFPKCMSCLCPVLYETIIFLLKKFYENQRKLLDKYQKLICELFSSIHRNYQFCTGADCNNCIKVCNLNLRTVRCTCGKSFCFKCKSDDHSPCSCEDKKLWLQNVLKEEADAKWMSIHTKLCPWCKKAVERSAGCNFMSCVCGKSFCYLCSRPWEPDHKDHFKCHIYKKSTNQTVSRQKQILEKINFFTQRFLDNQMIAENNKKVDTFQQRKLIFKNLKIDLSDSQFIQTAYKFSIECCDSLKWIYAYSYYAVWKNDIQKSSYQFDQGEFQKYKTNLLKMLAVDLKNFLISVQKNGETQLGKQQNQQQLIQKFKELKKNVVNYFTMTKKYKEKLVQEIQNRSQDPVIKKKKSSAILDKKQKKQTTNHGKITQNQQKQKQKKKLFGRYFT